MKYKLKRLTMKLELKHLAPYLPYGLRVSRYDNQFYKGYVIHNVLGLTEDFRYKKEDLDPDDSKDLLKLKQITFWLDEGYGINNIVYDVKPILHPLSDLTKEIEVNGENVNIFDRIEIYKGSGVDYLIEQIRFGFVEVIIYNILLEYHFDVFGLIEKGLAIDMNTL